MNEIIITLNQLRSMIGLHINHNGVACQVIELLEDSPSLVLQSFEELYTIQPDQHGEARRRVPATYTIPVLNNEGTELHPLFLALDLEYTH